MIKGKIVLIVIILLLASNIYTYIHFNRENLELRNALNREKAKNDELSQSVSWLENSYAELNERYQKLMEENHNLSLTIQELQTMNEILNTSYHEVLEANKRIAKSLEDIGSVLIVPYNYTLMGYYDFIAKFTYAYSDEMKEFILNITNGWDGTEEDFLSDLYKIYKSWHDSFTFVSPSPSQENLTFINIGTWGYTTNILNDVYLKYVTYEVLEAPIIGAQISFRYKKGVCWDYATALVSLFYAYSDMIERKLSVGYLSIGLIERGSHHGCVLIKEHGDMIAIIDWDVITRENEKVIFMPFEKAKELHEKYWNCTISYDSVGRRTSTSPFVINHFSSNEEFYKWLVEEFD
ncbi:MAG: hypothetical protein QW303_00370 [Nitrososphaerota archaeon]